MIREVRLRVLPFQAADTEKIKQAVARETGDAAERILGMRILKKSIDARQRQVVVNLTVQAFVDELPAEPEFPTVSYGDVSGGKPVVVVGAGPAGLFAALRLIELGMKPIVVERGKNVRDRKRDIARISREQKVDPESNYSFGEGGAGAFSDGKLYTRSKKRGSVEKILQVFCQHGASTNILYDAHPHIGTDRLPRVIENMRNQILRSGGEMHFQTKMTKLVRRGDEVVGIECEDGRQFMGPVILATGHSARDVYHYLYEAKYGMEAKGIAVGVRLEHPSKLIDQIQYHSREGRGKYLPAAEYSFVTQVGGRGVYSFCMCPGGFVVPAASGANQVVVNGMSPSNRGSRWSNSGMVVEVRPEDCAAILNREWNPADALCVMEMQQELERLCYEQAGGTQHAPAQRMGDFVQGRRSADLPESSYTPGVVSVDMHQWMPRFITGRLREAFQVFGKKSKGFLTNEAVLLAVETRTSAPVRILRNAEDLQHVVTRGLFPCGEGAGYAGGIVSAAIDGERCADAAAAVYHQVKA